MGVKTCRGLRIPNFQNFAYFQAKTCMCRARPRLVGAHYRMLILACSEMSNACLESSNGQIFHFFSGASETKNGQKMVQNGHFLVNLNRCKAIHNGVSAHYRMLIRAVRGNINPSSEISNRQKLFFSGPPLVTVFIGDFSI